MASSTVLKSLPESVWASRVMEVLQMFAVPLTFYFKPVCVCVATFWCVHEAWELRMAVIGTEYFQANRMTAG